MNELAPSKTPVLPNAGQAEAAGLRDLVGMLNNPAITGAEVPAAEITLPVGNQPSATPARPTPSTTPLVPEATLSLPATPLLVAPRENTQRIFFTGRFKTGKDYAANAAGYKIFGFADPLYTIASYFFGVEVSSTKGKDLPGMRSFLQSIGQWGRGEVNEKYPFTAERAAITEAIRNFPSDLWPHLAVNWDEFGRNQNIWVDACIRRVNQFLLTDPAGRVAITNVRFTNEFKALRDAGWVHFHCMCSSGTWAQRLLPLTPQSPEVRDMSEKLAADLDANVTQQISKQAHGHRLHCIWNDQIPSPSPRLHTLQTFLAEVAPA